MRNWCSAFLAAAVGSARPLPCLLEVTASKAAIHTKGFAVDVFTSWRAGDGLACVGCTQSSLVCMQPYAIYLQPTVCVSTAAAASAAAAP
jgi:hypothetical protein